MWCESCCDGTDLGPGDTCNACGTTSKVVGYYKLEYPMTKEDEDRKIPIIEFER